ncbi:hypothetical protein EDD85DRAFT_786204 [Armillaria nabsnona]|nr:hypothetical protein EDD85DRAFT_786204 [Armillaria nabsnona]
MPAASVNTFAISGCVNLTYVDNLTSLTNGNPVPSTRVTSSTTSYSAIDYLLDKANIHDTVTKMMLYVDLLRWNDIEKEVFTDHIRVDYTSLLGGEVVDVTSKEQVTANVTVTLVPKDGEKGLVQNGGRYLIEVSRITPSDGGNPWRISSLEVDVIYSDGNKDFYKGQD